jgi:phenylacetaldehyde dehydrogenase
MHAQVQITPLSSEVESFVAKPRQVLIDGRWVGARSGKTFDVFDPSTGRPIAKVAACEKEDVDAAVAAARKAFDKGPWPRMSPSQRGRIIWKIGDLILENLEELAQLESLDNGKPIAVARAADVPLAADLFHYMAGWATKIEGNTISLSVPYTPGAEYHAFTRREPIGVVGQIIPWNFPLLMAAWKLGPALAAGCTIVLKLAEETPLSGLRLAELCQEAGLPEGVVNVLTGFGETCGAPLAAHPQVDKVAFTGSTEVGKLIVKAASNDLKKVTLELGGKSPNIILDDADMEIAIPGAANAIFFNHGQCCCAGSRLFVQEKKFDQVVEGVTQFAKNIRLGPGLDSRTQMGPLVSQTQLERVSGFLRAGEEEGAKALCREAPWRYGLLRGTHGARRYEARHEGVPRGDFWPGGHRDPLQERGRRSRRVGQRYDLRPCRRHLFKGHGQGAPHRQSAAIGNGVDQLLQHLRCGAAVRRVQAVGLGSRDGPRCPEQLSRDQSHLRRNLAGRGGMAASTEPHPQTLARPRQCTCRGLCEM